VETVTSVTGKRTRLFSTPVGAFSYAHIPPRAYPVGIDLDIGGPAGVLMATMEKALCDQLALAAHLRTIKGASGFPVGHPNR